MKARDFLWGLAAGAAIGASASALYIKVEHSASAETVLEAMRDAFKRQGPIDGSWIVMQPEPYAIEGMRGTAYRGGVTRATEEGEAAYEFLIDSKTGAILSLTLAR